MYMYIYIYIRRSEACSERRDDVRDWKLHITQTEDCTKNMQESARRPCNNRRLTRAHIQSITFCVFRSGGAGIIYLN